MALSEALQSSWKQPASSELTLHIYLRLPVLSSLHSQDSAVILSTFPWCFQLSYSLLQITSNISQTMNQACLQLVTDVP